MEVEAAVAVAAAAAAGFYAARAAKSPATGPDIAEMAAFRNLRLCNAELKLFKVDCNRLWMQH